MAEGHIKHWNEKKNYGFIKPVDGGSDLFFHGSSLLSSNFRPAVGAPVEFVAAPNPKKPGEYVARNVTVSAEPRAEVASRSSKRPGAGARHQPGPSASLPAHVIFDNFFNAERELRKELFFDAAQAVAHAWRSSGFKSSQFRQLYNGLRSIVAPLREKRIGMPAAQARFGEFYTERIVRQNLRKVLPNNVKEFFDAHKDLGLSSLEQLLGLFRYVKNIYCYFGEEDEK